MLGNTSITLGNNQIVSNVGNLDINMNGFVNISGNLFVKEDINFVGNIYNNGNLFIGPTGPQAGTLKALPTKSYYISQNISVVANYTTTIMYDTYDETNSSGSVDFIYDTNTGILVNPTQDVMTINLSGQIQTSNSALDVSENQPTIFIVKNKIE
jgi:hypothetical protein